MSYEVVDGFATGLLVPNERPTTFAPLADTVGVLSQDDIRSIIAMPSRVAGRRRFGADWIRNQGGRGSCNGYAAAKALERSRVFRGLTHIVLSGEGLYAQINGGRDVGSGLDEGMRAITNNGVPPEDMVPHEEFRWSRISDSAKAACSRFRAVECYRVDTDLELASGLALGFIGVVAVHASNTFMRLDADGVVAATDGVGNHAVGVDDVRWRDGEFQYDMFNSWGTRYGTDGRGWLSWRRHFRTPSRYHAFYLIRSASDDPQGDNPPGGDDADVVTLEVFSRDGCGWCEKFAREELRKFHEAGWVVKQTMSGGQVPRFKVTVGGNSREFIGFRTFDELRTEAHRLLG